MILRKIINFIFNLLNVVFLLTRILYVYMTTIIFKLLFLKYECVGTLLKQYFRCVDACY